MAVSSAYTSSFPCAPIRYLHKISCIYGLIENFNSILTNTMHSMQDVFFHRFYAQNQCLCHPQGHWLAHVSITPQWFQGAHICKYNTTPTLVQMVSCPDPSDDVSYHSQYLGWQPPGTQGIPDHEHFRFLFGDQCRAKPLFDLYESHPVNEGKEPHHGL